MQKMAFNNKISNSDEFDGDRPLRLEHRFLVLRKLGQGTYGKVQLALNKETNEEVAVKTIKKCKIENEEDMLRIRREIHIMTSLRHPHIIHINEVFETKQKIVIVMQYASGGELYDYLGCHQTLPEDEARRIFRQIASAIYYCHMNQICHRDLKLENILLDEEGNAKIADFGLSNIFDDKRRMNTFCGSPLYASPEIVKGTPYKGPEVDCWSLGVLLYTLVYGTMPFDGRSFKELVTQISEGRYEEPTKRSNASSLIRWLLTPDITRRATISDVCKDSWVNQGYDTSLLAAAETMASEIAIPREQINATKLSLEGNIKNGREKSIFRKAAMQLEEKAEKFTSLLTKNFENIRKTNDAVSQTRKPNLYEQMTNYDVRFVLNKLIAAVEASLNADKSPRNSVTLKRNIATARNVQRREETVAEKVDSAYVIPIFEVTSIIPNESKISSRFLSKKSERTETINPTLKVSTKQAISKSDSDQNTENGKTSDSGCKNVEDSSGNNNSLQLPGVKNNLLTDTHPHSQNLLTDSQKQFYSSSISGQPGTHKVDFQTRNLQHDLPVSSHPSPKTKQLNDDIPFGQKHPCHFMRTKQHVLTLARLLSLNYEKIMRNSFKMPTNKKKLPGKITIPPTFDPKNPPRITKKQQEEKKELLIFPTVSVSENKVKIEKKIEKIKKAALNKNIIIRSDSKTRMRIENYIRSQVKKIQDIVCEEQRSLHASLENLDEQSLRDMSEMYYCAFGSENTDSGIANTEDEEYFCFLCSKLNGVKGTSSVVDSSVLKNIKKGCLYTSNHLHIPTSKEQNKWGYASNNSNIEFGLLTRCKSEAELPIEYANYVSSNKKSDLNKSTHHQQRIKRNDIGNTKYFLTVPSTVKSNNSNLRILRSASDTVGLNLSKNSFEILKLTTNGQDEALQSHRLFPHFLQQTSNGCNCSQMTDYETQSSATFINTTQMLEKDDGIGDSNDSFQSYIETLQNVENDTLITRSTSSHSYTNFTKDNSNSSKQSSVKLVSEYNLHKYEDFENQKSEQVIADILDSTACITALDKNESVEQTGKNRGLRRRNTITCIQDKNEGLKYDPNRTEFENYLWNAYKEHLLENNQNDTEYSSSPNLNYYTLDRKTKFKSMDYINGENSTDFITKLSPNFMSSLEQDSKEASSSKNVLKRSNMVRGLTNRSASCMSRTKSICGETLTDSNRDDIIRRLREERKLSEGNMTLDLSNGTRSPFTSSFLNDLQKRDQERKANGTSNRRHCSKSNLPLSKRTKSEYKKSFLQLLALKRIQEAEKELDKAPRSELLNVEEHPGTLLEALKTHGYKTVISQRFQGTDDDSFDSFQMKYLKSPRNLRAELARLNYMYYESLPRYILDTYEESDYFYDDLDYTKGVLNGLLTPSFYDIHMDLRQQASNKSVYDWLDTTQIDEYKQMINNDTKRQNSLSVLEETTPTPEMRRCCTQWGKENYRSFDDESTSESQDTIEESTSNGPFNTCSKIKELKSLNEVTNPMNSERPQTCCANIDDERQESVQDRIWRKSFYSRFNNRALSRKERSSFIETELSESRFGLLNNLYNPLKTGYEKSDILQCDGSNKSLPLKRLKKLSPSPDKFESGSSIKKKYIKHAKDRETVLGKGKSSYKNTEICNTTDEEPENSI